MARVDPSCDAFAKLLLRHATAVEKNVDALVPRVFIKIADRVVTYTPLWSGQARLNWTAHVGSKRPPKRLVSVPRSNAKLRKSKGMTKLSDPGEGDYGTIELDTRVTLTAKPVAMAAIKQVSSGYKHPYPPSQAPKKGRRARRAAPKLYLSNSLSYIHKLWSGNWPSNPRNLQDVVTNAARGPIASVRLFRGV